MAIHFPITLSHNDQTKTIATANEIAKKLKPQWANDEAQLNFQYFTEGITNTILSVWCTATGPDERILMRIYGEKTELLIDRNAEKRNLTLLHRYDCAPPLLGTFENGIIYDYIPGRVLEVEDVHEPHLAELITKRMAHMHTVREVAQDKRSFEPVLIPKITEYIQNMPTHFEDDHKQRRLQAEFPSKTELLSQLSIIRDKVQSMKSPVVFCHNDLLIKNLIYDATKDVVHFIDYEYAGYNFQAFDIGNHFCEYAGVENIDFSRFPNEKYQKWWLQKYLKYLREFTNADPPTEHDVDLLYVQVNTFAALSHFWWSIWAIIQARYSTINFDFLQYGIDRMNEYKRMKARYWDWKLPE